MNFAMYEFASLPGVLDVAVSRGIEVVAQAVFQNAALKSYTRPANAPPYTPQALTEAITKATGKKPCGYEFVDVPDVFSEIEPTVAYDERAPFANSLALALDEANGKILREAVDQRFDCDSFYSALWTGLRQDIATPLGITFWDDPPDAAKTATGESLMVGLFFFFAFAAIGELDQARRFEDLVRLFAQIIPIAELRGGPEKTWRVARVPAFQWPNE